MKCIGSMKRDFFLKRIRVWWGSKGWLFITWGWWTIYVYNKET